MVPLTALLVPRFVIFKTLGLTDSYVPLIASSVLLGTSPFYVLLYYWSFRRLPRELIDAARLEGLGPIAIWRRVAMPLVKPVTVAVGVLAFVFSWSNFLDPLIYLFDSDKFTLPLGLRSLATLGQQDYPILLAGAVTATLPVIGAFLYVQRFFLGGHRNLGLLET
jgi:multiple sugar transport system permease protein